MFGLPLAFAAPAVLAALVGLVGLYFLLRVTPPSPRQAIFPPLRLLVGLEPNETTPARMPWPILALRLAIGALIILAMAEPLWNSLAALSGSAPLLVLIDDGFAAAPGSARTARLPSRWAMRSSRCSRRQQRCPTRPSAASSCWTRRPHGRQTRPWPANSPGHCCAAGMRSWSRGWCRRHSGIT